jgi:hypothetical protein
MPPKPSPASWTLRFKHSNFTVLLEVDPLQKLSTVRSELLHALQESNPSGEIYGHKIPQQPDDILLGRAIDRNKLHLGYTDIDKDATESSADVTGKGKAAVGALKAKPGVGKLTDCPQGAGFRNGDVVAFKFRGDEDVEEVVEKWDVKIPSMEETYGDEDAAARDEGIGMEEG